MASEAMDKGKQVTQNLGAIRASLMTKLKQQPSDVFVGTEEQPRLVAYKLEQGHYKDAKTGETIHAIENVKNPVVDSQNNDTVVLEQKDLDKLNRIDPVTKKRVSVKVSKVSPADKLSGLLNKKSASVLVSDMRSKLSGLPMDVYVEGEKAPRLLGVKMLRGEYFDKESGNPIRHESQIKGAVVDKDGTVLVALEELPKLS